MLKRILFIMVAMLACAAQVTSQELQYYVVEDVAAPFQLQDGDGKQSGIVTEIVYAVSNQKGINLVTIPAPSKRIERALNDVTAFDWITYDAPVWHSLAGGKFLPEPLFEVKHAALHCSEKAADTLFENKPTIAVIKGFRYPELSDLSEQGKLELVNVRDHHKGIELVGLGRVDAFIEMSTRIQYQLAHSETTYPCNKLTDVSHIIKPYPIHLAVNKSMDPAIALELNRAIIELKNSGKLDEIRLRYEAK